MELDEPSAHRAVEDWIDEPDRELREKADIEVLSEVASRQHLIARRKGLQKFSEFLAVTRVYRGYVLAALTRPLACRLCRLQPPSPSPAPCRVYDGRARRLHRPALALRQYW